MFEIALSMNFEFLETQIIFFTSTDVAVFQDKSHKNSKKVDNVKIIKTCPKTLLFI